MMEVTGLVLAIGSIFPTCMKAYKTLASLHSFQKEKSSVYWKLKIQELRFTTWGEAYGLEFDSVKDEAEHANTDGLSRNHSVPVLQLTSCILKAMQETLSNVDKLNRRYGLEVIGPAIPLPPASGKMSLLRFQWVLNDKLAFTRLIDDLKDYNDGLHSTLLPVMQRNVDFSVCNQVSVAADQVEALHTIEDISTSLAIRGVASFKAFNLELHDRDPSEITQASSLELLLSALAIGEDQCTEALEVRSRATYTIGDNPSQEVIVEWKYYEDGLHNKTSTDRSVTRIKRLVRLLAQNPKPEHFRTLDCVGYLHDRVHSRIGLVFNVELYHSTLQPLAQHPLSYSPWITLHDLIGQRPKMPLLGHRIGLSVALLKSVIGIHSTGWLHKAFQSRNIIFFGHSRSRAGERNVASSFPMLEPTETHIMDIRDPRIMGFEFSRPNNRTEFSDIPVRNWMTLLKIYTHPEYLEPRRSFTNTAEISDDDSHTRFKQEYDMYSLGCVLLEIGLWRRLTDLWRPELSPVVWAQRLTQKYAPELGGRCGETYQKVVLSLLSSGDRQGQQAHPVMTNFELLQALVDIRT
jgi:hypothetical protein